MDEGWYFAIYKSPDLITWQKIPGGAIKAPANTPPTTMPTAATSSSTNTTSTKRAASELTWARDWQWAPEVYHNDKVSPLLAPRLLPEAAADLPSITDRLVLYLLRRPPAFRPSRPVLPL
jgi:hypothetical protein